MASQTIDEKPQITHLGGFLLRYVENGQVKEAFTHYISRRQREILEARISGR